MKYDWNADPDFFGEYTLIPLSDGRFVHLGWNELVSFYRPHTAGVTMAVCDPGFTALDDETWEHEGEPINPGNIEVFGLMADTWDELEERIREFWTGERGGCAIVVGGVTERLFNVYKKLLVRPGFISVGAEMMKWVK